MPPAVPPSTVAAPPCQLAPHWESPAPSVTPSVTIALEVLKLGRPDVIHAGEHTFALRPQTRAVAFARLARDLERL